MKFFSTVIFAALAALAAATSLDLEKRDNILDVKLDRVSNSVVKVSLTNTGAKTLKLFNKGTILDSLATEKVHVYQKDSKVAFQGIKIRPLLTDVSDDALTNLKAGKTLTMEVDVAAAHDVANGGTFSLFSQGAIPYAEAGSNEITDSILFKSNTIDLNIDGAKASKVAKAYSGISKRTDVQDCTGTKLSQFTSALSYCRQLATAAATAATSGSASKFSEYFKTTSSSTRSTVAARFRAVATECSSTTSGATDQYCSDVYGACSSNVLAYTLPSNNVVVNCNLYYTALPVISSTCHAQDMATTTLHEYTHAPGVYSPGTDDYAYGYSASTALSSARAVLNADTYALYANAIYVGC